MTDLSPVAVINRLVKLSLELDEAQREAADLGQQAARAKNEAERQYSREFLTAAGPMDIRKETARQATADARLAADLAAEKAAAVRSRIAVLRTQVEVGRSLSAALRAESES